MYFRCKATFISYSFILFVTSIVFISCESKNVNNDEEVLRQLRPLKYGKSESQNCKEFCQNIECQQIKACPDDSILEKESYCKCCYICVKYLDFGDPCSLTLGGQRKCRPGTKCENGKCVLDSNLKGCFFNREIRFSLQGKEDYSTNIWIPQCDKTGNFKEKQKKISKSICVDESGNRLFGRPTDSSENNCVCSRYIQKNKADAEYNTRPQEHCSLTGNFDTLQCIGNLCYCADNKTGEIRSPLVRLEFLDKLPCYDIKKHVKGYLRNCEVEVQRSQKLVYEFRLKKVNLSGIQAVECDPDGTFKATQCRPGRCICIDNKGVQIESYFKDNDIKGEAKRSMICNCARDESNSKMAFSYTCLESGNYNPLTCFEDKCFCIDEDGDNISKAFDKKNIDVNTCKEMIRKLSEESQKEIIDDNNNIHTEEYDYYDDDSDESSSN